MALSIEEKSRRYELLLTLIRIINDKEKPTADRMKNLNGRIDDGYSDGDFIWAARALSKSQWHKDNGEMSIDNLIRPSKFGRWFNSGQIMKEEQTAKSKDPNEEEELEKFRRGE